MAFDAGEVNVRLGADFTDQQEFDKYDKAIARAEAKKRVEAKLGGEFQPRAFAEYEKALDKAEAKAKRRGAFKAELGGDFNPRAFREYEKALDSASSSTRRFHGETDRAHGSMLRLGSATQAFSRILNLIKPAAIITGLGLLAQAASSAAAGIVGLTGSLGALSPAAAGLAGVATAGAQAIGVFRIATKDLGEAINGSATALKRLTPEGKKFVDEFGPKLKDIQAIAQKGVLAGLAASLSPSLKVLSAVRKITAETSTELGKLIEQGAKLLSSGPFSRDFQTIGRRNIKVIDDLGSAALSLANATRNILAAAGPLTEWMSGLVRTGARAVSTWTEQARATGKLASAFNLAKRELQLIGPLLGNTAQGLGRIILAGRPLGDFLIKDLAEGAKWLNQWTQSTRGQAQLARFFEQAKKPLHEFLLLTRDVTTAFFRLGQGSQVAPLIRMVRTELLPAFTQLIQTTTRSLGPVLINTLKQILLVFSDIAGSSGPLHFFIVGLGQAAKFTHELFKEFPILKSVVVALAAIGGISKALGIVTAVSGVKTLVGLLRTARGVGIGAAAAQAVGIAPAARAAVPVAAAGAGVAGAGAAAGRGSALAAFGGPAALAAAGAVIGRIIVHAIRSTLDKDKTIPDWLKSVFHAVTFGPEDIAKDLAERIDRLFGGRGNEKVKGFATLTNQARLALKNMSGEAGVLSRSIGRDLPSAIARSQTRLEGYRRTLANTRNGTKAHADALRDMRIEQARLDRALVIAGKRTSDQAANIKKYRREVVDAQDKLLGLRRGSKQYQSAAEDLREKQARLNRAIADGKQPNKNLSLTLVDLRSDAKRARDRLEDLKDSGRGNSKEADNLRGKIKVLNDRITDTRAAARQAAKGLDNTSESAHDLSGAVSSSARTIESQLNKALKALGVKPVAFAGHPSGKTTPRAGGDAAQGAARGGWIGGRGMVSDDVVPIGGALAAFGEYMAESGSRRAIINRHQAPYVDYALASGGYPGLNYGPGLGTIEAAMAPFGGLDSLFSRVTKPHYLAKGGRFAEGGREGSYTAMVAKANAIDSKHYHYSYGGGHVADFGPHGGNQGTGYDCSGAVSAVLHAGGLLKAPMTSGQLASWGAPGPGRVTVYANAGHTFMRLAGGGRLFGTGMGNPGGGAGWAPIGAHTTSGFTVRHADAIGGVAGMIKRILLGGPAGAWRSFGQGVLDKTRGAANKYLEAKQAATFGGGQTGGGDPIEGGRPWKGSGKFVSTAYGPPWGGIEGGGTTATGIDLHGAPHKLIVATDPSVIPMHSELHISPNPFNTRGTFQAEDTGGAIKGNRIDFYDWLGRSHQNAWGRRNVNVSGAQRGGFLARFARGGYDAARAKADIGVVGSKKVAVRSAEIEYLNKSIAAKQHEYDNKTRSFSFNVTDALDPGDATHPPSINAAKQQEMLDQIYELVGIENQIREWQQRIVVVYRQIIAFLTAAKARLTAAMQLAHDAAAGMRGGGKAQQKRKDAFLARAKKYKDAIEGDDGINAALTEQGDLLTQAGYDVEDTDFSISELVGEARQLTEGGNESLAAALAQAQEQFASSQTTPEALETPEALADIATDTTTPDQSAIDAQTIARLTRELADITAQVKNQNVLGGPADIGTTGLAAGGYMTDTTIWQQQAAGVGSGILGQSGVTSGGATVNIYTLTPGDPQTLAAVADAANRGNDLQNPIRSTTTRVLA